MELPYEEGQPIPAGYRVVQQPRRGLVIAGGVVTGVLWALSTTVAVAADFDQKSGWLLVPGVGPWLMLATGGGKDPGTRAALTLDGIGQTAGAAIFITGLAFPTKRLIRRDVTVSVVPTRLGRDGYGLGVVGAF